MCNENKTIIKYRILRVRIGAAAGAVQTTEVLVVFVLSVLLLVWLQPAPAPQPGGPAVAPEVPLGVELNQTVSLEG